MQTCGTPLIRSLGVGTVIGLLNKEFGITCSVQIKGGVLILGMSAFHCNNSCPMDYDITDKASNLQEQSVDKYRIAGNFVGEEIFVNARDRAFHK